MRRASSGLGGFCGGYLVAAAAASILGDRTWSFPAALAGVAVVLGKGV